MSKIRINIGRVLVWILVVMALLLSTIRYVNVVREMRMMSLYVEYLEEATRKFQSFSSSRDLNEYWDGVSDYNSAVRLVQTEGKKTDIYEESETLLAVQGILNHSPLWAQDNINELLDALSRIILNPTVRVSYVDLLNFYNKFNYGFK